MSTSVRREAPSVLVVDDDVQDRVLLSTVLRREGYTAISAAGADEARALLEERDFTLVVCDVRMPGESGVSLAKHVAAAHPGTAMIMISGSADPSTAEAVAPLGPFLVKPFSVDRFLLEVAGILVHRTGQGAALEASERRSRELLAELLQAEDRERRRVAAELHDDTLQVIVAGLMRLDRLEERFRDDEPAAADIGEIRRQLSDAVDRARLMLFQLHPRDLDRSGLSVAIPALVERMARDAGIGWEAEATVGRHSAALEQLVFRTVREALANVRKHARATRVAVVLREDGSGVCGSVVDDGVGFVVESVRSRPDPLHFGLHVLAARIRAAGGEVWVESGPGQGAALRFAIPDDGTAKAR
ncbi:MAG: hypothetical protein QOJ13_1284 [Gaiellales bacterium]|nr:hypothetical protein [Gaiellales bacterium]